MLLLTLVAFVIRLCFVFVVGLILWFDDDVWVLCDCGLWFDWFAGRIAVLG